MFGDTECPTAPHQISYPCTLQVLLPGMMLAYSRYQTNQWELVLLQGCAYFIPDYATESLVTGRNAREQRLIRHSAGEAHHVYNITLIVGIQAPARDSSSHQTL
ncbi:hypothetical protein [Chroococcidiopsis sp. CCMEE 29]|uniref:hypothetical protein n=1 Tax=Chroococcidiopsis sp. CCMEE 29 TaxID=155894 RepID=UPI00202027DA|nr:hypothetical protein [Chroococcidiopsis sp. CCMEE 29]